MRHTDEVLHRGIAASLSAGDVQGYSSEMDMGAASQDATAVDWKRC